MTFPLKTLVIADDDPIVLSVLREVCAQLGYEIAGLAQNGAEAVELVSRTKPHVILIDLHMPVLDGLGALRQIVPLGHTAVVLLTGDKNPALAREAMDAGASGYMQKPFESAQIGAILESAWHQFQTVASLQEKNRQLDVALELRKLTEKAKGILMEQQGFTEDQAHRCLLKMSQDQGIAMKEVCRSVIQVRMLLGKNPRKVA